MRRIDRAAGTVFTAATAEPGRIGPMGSTAFPVNPEGNFQRPHWHAVAANASHFRFTANFEAVSRHITGRERAMREAMSECQNAETTIDPSDCHIVSVTYVPGS